MKEKSKILNADNNSTPSEPMSADVGVAIRAVRLEHGLTTEEVGRLFNVDKATISRIERHPVQARKASNYWHLFRELLAKNAFAKASIKKRAKVDRSREKEKPVDTLMRENRKRKPLYLDYLKLGYNDTGASPAAIEIMLKSIKDGYKENRILLYSEQHLNNKAWNNILNGTHNGKYFLALANFLFEWSHQSGYAGVKNLPDIYFREALFPIYKKNRVPPQPNQIFSERTAELWVEHWRGKASLTENKNSSHLEPLQQLVKQEERVIKVADSPEDFVAGIDCEPDDGDFMPLTISKSRLQFHEKPHRQEKKTDTEKQVVSWDDIDVRLMELCGGEAEYLERLKLIEEQKQQESLSAIEQDFEDYEENA